MNTVKLGHLSRSECALLMTLHTLDGLRDKGIIEGGKYRASPDGRAHAIQLTDAGFEFNPGELDECLRFLFNA